MVSSMKSGLIQPHLLVHLQIAAGSPVPLRIDTSGGSVNFGALLKKGWVRWSPNILYITE